MKDEYVRYEKEIRENAASLEGEEKQVAGDILNDLLRQGHSLRFAYLAFSLLKGRSVIKYRHLMFNKSFQDEVWRQYLLSIAEDLDNVLFNYSDAEDIHLLQNWIDIDAYNRKEREYIILDRGNHEKYRNDVLSYLFVVLKGLSAIDVNAVENILNTILIKEEDDS